MDISDYSIYLIEMTECGSVLDGHIIPGEPLVSVSVITYNHGKYIRQCLDGILIQKVNFPYEVLVHDDASPDDTADIIREYEARFPTVIKPIYQTENQYSKHDGTIGKIQYGRAKGKYVAYCEGDDYWTDSRKLQIQVDFLEEHEEYIGCVHKVNVIDGYGENISDIHPFPPGYNDKDYTLKSLGDINGNECCGHLSSLIHRNIFLTLPKETLDKYYMCNCNGDTKLTTLLVLNGPIKRFLIPMSTYRHNILPDSTSWSANNLNIKIITTLNWFEERKKFAQNTFGIELSFSTFYLDLIVSQIEINLRHIISHKNFQNNGINDLFGLCIHYLREIRLGHCLVDASYVSKKWINLIIKHIWKKRL